MRPCHTYTQAILKPVTCMSPLLTFQAIYKPFKPGWLAAPRWPQVDWRQIAQLALHNTLTVVIQGSALELSNAVMFTQIFTIDILNFTVLGPVQNISLLPYNNISILTWKSPAVAQKCTHTHTHRGLSFQDGPLDFAGISS